MTWCCRLFLCRKTNKKGTWNTTTMYVEASRAFSGSLFRSFAAEVAAIFLLRQDEIFHFSLKHSANWRRPYSRRMRFLLMATVSNGLKMTIRYLDEGSCNWFCFEVKQVAFCENAQHYKILFEELIDVFFKENRRNFRIFLERNKILKA